MTEAFLALVLLNNESARISSLPPMRTLGNMRRKLEIMKGLKRMLLAATMLCIVVTGAFAQNRREDPPPKQNPPPKVRVEPNKNPPPNEGQRRGDDNGNHRGRP